MAANGVFERNLLALGEKSPELAARLRAAKTAGDRYVFKESAKGEIIPALPDPSGAVRPLHSMMDPKKEARRLIATVENEGFLILLGLGGGYYAEAALERDDISMVLVVEYDADSLSELARRVDYTRIFGDPRFRIFVDISNEDLESRILELYQPVLSGGIRVIPLRPRTGLDSARFTSAGTAIQAAINRVSADYSVQTHFGKRWFSNVIRNLKSAERAHDFPPRISRAAISAAGPSLPAQLPALKQKRRGLFLIATDTSLPCLLHEDLIPDAVISIDCQHISYYHFMSGLPKEVPLFLDLASPPLLARLSGEPRFFSGGHPLTRYISQTWKTLPELDVSGGNVTYAALSLAEFLGAAEIELYGADFSYPLGIAYARGSYIYSLFGKTANRFSPLEAQSSAFLFRTQTEKKNREDGSWYYETGTLRFYRERLEEKSGNINAELIPVEGLGAPIKTRPKEKSRREAGNVVWDKRPAEAERFLRFYQNGIAKLPRAGKNAAEYQELLEGGALSVFATILPAAAALKRQRPAGNFGDLIEETKAFCVKEIETVLAARF